MPDRSLETVFSVHAVPFPAVVGAFRIQKECNAAYCSLYGYAAGELIGKSFRMIYLDNAEYVRSGTLWRKGLERDGSYIDERIMVRADGSKFWCEVRGTTLAPDNPTSLVLFVVQPILRPVDLTGHALTRRQRQILALVAQGKTSRVIGAEIGISFRSVEAHRLRLMRDIGVRNTAGLIAWFSDQGRADI